MRKPSDVTMWIVFAVGVEGFAIRELFRLCQGTPTSLLLSATAGLVGVVLPLVALRYASKRAARILACLVLPTLGCLWLNWETGLNRHALFASELWLLVAVTGFFHLPRPGEGGVLSR